MVCCGALTSEEALKQLKLNSNKKKMKITFQDETISLVRDGEYQEAIAEAPALSSTESFRIMVNTSRQPLLSIPNRRPAIFANMKL